MNANGNGKTRDANGHFAIGNPGGPGRPPGKDNYPKYRKALFDAVSEEHIKSIAANLIKFAISDDHKAAIPAARVLLEQLAPPPQRIEFSADIHAVSTVRLIAEAVKNDPEARDTILALDQRVGLAGADGDVIAGALRQAGDEGQV